MLFDFHKRLAVVAGKTKIRTVYFHNFSRFDGILLMRYFVSHGDKYRIKPLMRNHSLYELKEYRGKKQLYRIRDSYTLLPSSLATLAKTLCPCQIVGLYETGYSSFRWYYGKGSRYLLD